MAEFEGNLNQLLTNASRANGEVKLAEDAIKVAKQRLVGAKAQRLNTFEINGQLLADLCESGEYSAADILYVQARLAQIDPLRLHVGELDPEELVARFKMLRDGQYCLDLEPEGKSPVTGVISGEPSNFRVIPPRINSDGIFMNFSLAPSIRFDLPFTQGDDSPEELDMSDYNLRFGIIGREAIMRAAQAAQFAVGSETLSSGRTNVNRLFLSRHTNSGQLARLREHIDSLFELGMEEFGTPSLDRALEQAAAYEKRARDYDLYVGQMHILGRRVQKR